MTSTPTAVPDIFAAAPAAVRVGRDVLRATGPDAELYLQGQLSQDVAAVDVGAAAWSLLLQPQGKVDAWLRVSRLGPTEFLLDLDEGAGPGALARLERFKLRTKCSFELATWTIVSVRGPGSESLALDGIPGVEIVAPAAWPGVEGVDLLGPDVAIPAGLTSAEAAELEALRIVCGVPAMGRELDESVIPAEAGVVARSVSFTKGCYTGQELVARIDSRGGNVPRRLRLVTVDGAAAVGDDVEVDGAVVGSLTSVALLGESTVGLAYVKRSVDPPASGLVAGRPARLTAVGA